MSHAIVNAVVTASVRSRRRARVGLNVDSGFVYSVLPRRLWRALGIKPMRTVELHLADGTSLKRCVGQANFTIDGLDAVSPVILGESGDEPLLGAVTLASMGFILNPLSRRLQPMRMMLARVVKPR